MTVNLDVSSKSLTDIIYKLKSSTTLETINLSDNTIGDEDAKALADALKTNKTLHTLDLSGNEIGDTGAKALADALKINTTLHALDLGYNSITEEGVKAIAQMLIADNTTLLYIDLSKSLFGIYTMAILEQVLSKNKNLKTLSLCSSEINKVLVQYLKKG